MLEEYGYTQAFKYYRQTQTKFDYFFIGVILASLSLSLQIKTNSDMCSFYLLMVMIYEHWEFLRKLNTDNHSLP